MATPGEFAGPSSADGRCEVCAELDRAVAIDHPVRVAIDGITAAGKTTFAEHLAPC